MKKMIEDAYRMIDDYSSYTRDEIVQRMDNELAELTEEQRKTAKFAIQKKDEGYYESSISSGLYIVWQRLETDAEEQKREFSDKAFAARQAERDRREFERLKAKFS